MTSRSVAPSLDDSGPVAAGLTCLVFDMDGTISNSWPIALTAFRAAIEGFAGRQFSDLELIALAGPAEEGILQKLFPNDWEVCFERYLNYYERELPNHEILFPGVYDLMKALRQRGTTLAVNSGKTLPAVTMTLKQAGIYDDFELVVGGSAAGDRKAENLIRMVEHFGLEPGQVGFVGDSGSDMEAARAAGVVSIGASWAPMTASRDLAVAGADVIFEEVEAFRAWLCVH